MRNLLYKPDEEMSIYNEEDILLMLEEDLIDNFEEAFMRGYIAS